MSESDITRASTLSLTARNPVRGLPLSRSGRVLLAMWGLVLLCGFALAATLEPDPRGYGTHQRLGLPPCSFRVLFDIPCPSCGSTTSFAHFVRGQWQAALNANTGAFALAMLCTIMVPWSWFSSWRGRLWRVEDPVWMTLWLLIGLCLLSTAQWIFRLLTG